MTAMGFAARSADAPLERFAFDRRAPRADDVAIDILYCGVCHTDLHLVRNHGGFTTYPIVPGHEIIGRVREVGAGVSRFKVGDMVGVGCMVDSCRHCAPCRNGWEQDCVEGPLIGSYEKAGVDVFLFDAVAEDGRVGSTGQTLDVDYVASLAEGLTRPFLIAGGISPDNRARHEALAANRLYLGIDVDTNARGDDGQQLLARGLDPAPPSAVAPPIEVEQGRVGDGKVAQQAPKMIHVPTAKWHHRDE